MGHHLSPVALEDDTPSEPTPLARLIREVLGGTDEQQLRPFSRKMAEHGPNTADSYRRMIHRWLDGQRGYEKNILIFAAAAERDPAPFLKARLETPRGIRTSRAELADLRAALEETREEREQAEQRLEARLLEVEERGVDRAVEVQDLALAADRLKAAVDDLRGVVGGLHQRVERLEGDVSRMRGSP